LNKRGIYSSGLDGKKTSSKTTRSPRLRESMSEKRSRKKPAKGYKKDFKRKRGQMIYIKSEEQQRQMDGL